MFKSNALFYIKGEIPSSAVAGDTFPISKDFELEENLETGVDNVSIIIKNNTQLERMVISATGGIATIIKRGLDQTEIKTEVPELRKTWSEGSIFAVTALASDLYDIDTAIATVFASKLDKTAGLRDGFPLNKVVYVDPATGGEVVKDTTQVSTFNDSDVILGRKPDGTEARGLFSGIKSQLGNAGKYIQTVAIGESISAGVTSAFSVISTKVVQNAIPAMTTNAGSGNYGLIYGQVGNYQYEVSASYPPYACFDAAGNTTYWWGSGSGAATAYIGVSCTVPMIFNSCSLGQKTGNPSFVSGWKIQASNNFVPYTGAGTWTDLYTATSGVTVDGTSYTFNFDNTTAYKYYRVYGSITGAYGGLSMLQFHVGISGAVSFTNTLGSNIAGSRVKSGIVWKPLITDVLGRVYTGQNATSASARIQLYDATGTNLIAEKTPSLSTNYADFTESVTINTEYVICINDSNYFNAQNNELVLSTYQSNNPYTVSGFLNGDRNVNPQAISRIDFGTRKAVKSIANYAQEYVNNSGFVTGPKSVGDIVELNANDGTLISGFSGLTPLSKYYISDTAGVISTTAGTISRLVGMAMSSTELYLSSPYYPGTNVTKP